METIRELNLNDLKFVGSGSSSDTYQLDNDRVILVGKRADSYMNYQRTFSKSKILDGKITAVNYSQIYEVIEPCENYPHGAMVEQFIPGVELRKCLNTLSNEDKVAIGIRLAMFLNELHAIPYTGDKAAEIDRNVAKFDKSVEMLKSYLDAEKLQYISQIRDLYIKNMQSRNFCVTHGDLNSKNILISSDHKVSGIIDFGNMEYYLPEVEFAHMYFTDQTIYDSMVSNYSRGVQDKLVILLELVMRIRHFKNIAVFEDKRVECLQNINELIDKLIRNRYLQSA